ncbi:MAG TPA: gamma-glutamylcyclotransferase [Dongiaceae bacterium]|jgi:cation transport protein ChaC
MALTAELVARCHRDEPDPGPEPGYPEFTEEEYDAAVAALLRDRKETGPLWLFAYGSLIWKPSFESVEHRRATVQGWHRAFCMEMNRWRGSPQQLGLMMALQRGGHCEGVAYRLPDGDLAAQVGRLLRREVSDAGSLSAVRWLSADIGGETHQALTFWVDPGTLDYIVTRPLPEVAHILARACGHVGSGAEYLFRTVSKLEELGIRDDDLWTLQELVAEEIKLLIAKAAADAP